MKLRLMSSAVHRLMLMVLVWIPLQGLSQTTTEIKPFDSTSVVVPNYLMREWANTINDYEIIKLKFEQADTLLSLYESKQIYYEQVYVVKDEVAKLLRAQYVDATELKDIEVERWKLTAKKQRRLLYVAVAVVVVETVILISR